MPELIDYYIDQEIDAVRNQTYEDIMAIQGDQLTEFLNNTELKDAVRSTVGEALDSIVDPSTMDPLDAEIWQFT